MIKKNFPLIFLMILSASLYSQLYTNATDNLPDNGAQGASMDVRAADVDGDSDLDIVLANEFEANTILLNNGNAVFENGTLGNLPQKVRDSEDVTIADFNDDGILDLIFCSEDDVVIGGIDVHEYYLGNGDGSFAESSYQFPDSEANAVIRADLNGDELPDVLFGNNGGTSILINQGDGTFVLENDRIAQLNKTTQDLVLADVDGDEDLDLFEGNENGNILHINDGNGFFTDETEDRLPQGLNIETRKVSFGDVDGDDDLDMFLSNVAFIPGKDRQNRLFLNDSEGNFTDVSDAQLPIDNDHTVDAIFEDVDLDDDLDLIVANVFGGPVRIYQNDGDGNFEDNTMEILGQFYFLDALGVIAADLNGDDLIDIYVCDRKAQASNNKDLLLIRNMTSDVEDAEKVDVNKFDFKVFPNPSSRYFSIQFDNEIPDSIVVENVLGKKVFVFESDSIRNGVLQIDMENHPSGTYNILMIKDERIKSIKQIVISK